MSLCSKFSTALLSIRSSSWCAYMTEMRGQHWRIKTHMQPNGDCSLRESPFHRFQDHKIMRCVTSLQSSLEALLFGCSWRVRRPAPVEFAMWSSFVYRRAKASVRERDGVKDAHPVVFGEIRLGSSRPWLPRRQFRKTLDDHRGDLVLSGIAEDFSDSQSRSGARAHPHLET